MDALNGLKNATIGYYAQDHATDFEVDMTVLIG